MTHGIFGGVGGTEDLICLKGRLLHDRQPLIGTSWRSHTLVALKLLEHLFFECDEVIVSFLGAGVPLIARLFAAMGLCFGFTKFVHTLTSFVLACHLGGDV